MNTNTKLGCFFLGLAAFLYSTKHLTAAIMVTNINTHNANYFDGGYDAVKTGITLWIGLSFLVGLTFFVSGILPQLRVTFNKKNTAHADTSSVVSNTSITINDNAN